MAERDPKQLPASFLTIEIADESATRQLANDLALVLKAGDVVCLSGDLGAGKSTFARALLRAFAGDPELEVPSPTFTLVQTYAFERFDLSHFDLYRLEEPEELEELGLDDLLATGAALIEWPEMAGGLLPQDALWIRITQPEEDTDARRYEFGSLAPQWQPRMALTRDIRILVERTEFQGARRRFLAGDASLRTFETVEAGDRTAVLMRWPFHDDAVSETVRAYMQKVHLAQDCRSVVAIGGELRRHGFLAPRIYAADLARGLVLSEDLGSETIVRNGAPVPERYRAAVDVLARLHGISWPRAVALEEGAVYEVPAYSTDALVAEASLFLDWYVPEATGAPADAGTRRDFETLWRAALDSIAETQRGWVLRDFHSPNLLWQEGAAGENRIGLIDFQDTVIGPVAYDVAALTFDARTDIGPELETELFDAYVSARERQAAGFDRAGFTRAYAVMAAQRISKILGIFVRLARRDDKPAYLAHLPRMQGYLDRVLDRPALSDLKGWYARYRP
ncbi:tRNA (adenosine(37)-N6)-threonylcarbamoyltransferase complex ATPase subunit type 1 TsaE [Labrenzia sp. 011]|uniref:tRNA (adenosine(37)-N6)-threonylcarbamoyltransferase complex ATPase subunit type 1 TsaE n=1 Tax=Labrenzia sp. 011 TaxID=2171494 RepID=UPI000D51378B|nr:tRNA (adenosine(37)-N6)-threonylcarbamoyltransferase complex ATPase subunit type 1 TsaE [Labrenzia sp. 011]PVB61382.1 tRNA (adenosine(37)-N6)-threonylcarbamoyltransferase complex ATPase subunit type 1 TsaE [Labrenzia sp. 011]